MMVFQDRFSETILSVDIGPAQIAFSISREMRNLGLMTKLLYEVSGIRGKYWNNG